MRGLAKSHSVLALLNLMWVNSSWNENKGYLDREREGVGTSEGIADTEWCLSPAARPWLPLPLKSVYIISPVEVICIIHFSIALPTSEKQSGIVTIIYISLRIFYPYFTSIKSLT